MFEEHIFDSKHHPHTAKMTLCFLQDLGQAALQGSPCPLASTPDCPALPTLENAAAALGLLATACLPLHSRWRIEAHLGLTQRLLQQMQSQGDLRLTFCMGMLDGLHFMSCTLSADPTKPYTRSSKPQEMGLTLTVLNRLTLRVLSAPQNP